MTGPDRPSAPIANRSMPPGVIIPELSYPDLDAAVAWLCATFGFTERLRIARHRAQLLVGEGAAVVAVQGRSQLEERASAGLPGAMAHALMVRVGDVDAHYAHVIGSGARVVQPPADYPYGERQYTVDDLAGHRWTFTQSIADIDPRTWGGVPLDGSA